MAIFTRKVSTVSLNDQLVTKSVQLRNKSADEADAAESLTRAAAQARVNSDTAAAHAMAVEQALTILGEAGVEL